MTAFYNHSNSSANPACDDTSKIVPGNTTLLAGGEQQFPLLDRNAGRVPASQHWLHGSAGDFRCEFALGKWRPESLQDLIRDLPGETMSARVSRIAWAFAGTPFQFESRLPLPSRGSMPVRLKTFDCFTYVITVLALAMAGSVDSFLNHLALLRYCDPQNIDSDPEVGTIFDFAEELFLINAVERGILRDVTHEICAASASVSVVLKPSRRCANVDPDQRWATPKLGRIPIAARLIGKADFGALETSGRLRAGDIVLMSRYSPGASHIVDHVGFVDRGPSGTHLLQCTRYFALHTNPQPVGAGDYTGIFYDRVRRLEQIGVGIAGEFVGDEHSFELNGLAMHGYRPGCKRALRSYLDGAFSSVCILRLNAPETWRL